MSAETYDILCPVGKGTSPENAIETCSFPDGSSFLLVPRRYRAYLIDPYARKCHGEYTEGVHDLSKQSEIIRYKNTGHGTGWMVFFIPTETTFCEEVILTVANYTSLSRNESSRLVVVYTLLVNMTNPRPLIDKMLTASPRITRKGLTAAAQSTLFASQYLEEIMALPEKSQSCVHFADFREYGTYLFQQYQTLQAQYKDGSFPLTENLSGSIVSLTIKENRLSLDDELMWGIEPKINLVFDTTDPNETVTVPQDSLRVFSFAERIPEDLLCPYCGRSLVKEINSSDDTPAIHHCVSCAAAAGHRESVPHDQDSYKKLIPFADIGGIGIIANSGFSAIAGAAARVAGMIRRRKKKQAEQASAVNEISRIDQVQFSALSNPSVTRKTHYNLRIFMYTEPQKTEFIRIKESMPELSRETSAAVPVPVTAGQQVTVRLSSDTVRIEENELTLPWTGSLRVFEFAYYVPENLSDRNISISAGIYIDQVIASRLYIQIPLEESSEPLPIQRSDVKEAFVSYASEDRISVLKIVQGMHKARPELQVFLDVESLRAGTDWKNAISSKIEKSDVLFLCWSRAAKESEWVDYEWRYGYKMKGINFIEPVPLEPPSFCRPPEELKSMHFSDVDMLLRMSEEYIRDNKAKN